MNARLADDKDYKLSHAGVYMLAVFKPSVRTGPSCGTQFSVKNRYGTIVNWQRLTPVLGQSGRHRTAQRRE